MEVSILARAIGNPWSMPWPKVKHNEEPRDTGRALSTEEEARLLKAAAGSGCWVLESFIRVLLLTAMRCEELTNMRWAQVDFEKRIVTVGKAKTDAGTRRQIPMNQELFDVFKGHAEWFTNRFGHCRNTSCSPLADAGRMTPPNTPGRSKRAGGQSAKKPRSGAGYMTSGILISRSWLRVAHPIPLSWPSPGTCHAP